MITIEQKKIEHTLLELFNDSKNDKFKMIKAFSKSLLRPIGPTDFKEIYLSISKEQGDSLKSLIVKNEIKNVVEFGTSFGISTLFLAQGILETGGQIITTELVESKAIKAADNFKKAGVDHIIEVRIGDAMETLKNHTQAIDFLLLDGWKNLYLPLFKMLEPNFHGKTIIYVDNADMSETKLFLNEVAGTGKYQMESKFSGKVILITLKECYGN